MAEPKKNTAYEFYLSLIDSVASPDFRVNPTIAAGDFKVSTDGGDFANLTTLPVVTPAGSISVKISLSAAEMNGDKAVLEINDQAGGEWDPTFVFIDISENTIDDIFVLIEKALFNKQITDRVTGKNTIFEDDGLAVFKEGDVFENAAGTVPYRGAGIDHRGRMT